MSNKQEPYKFLIAAGGTGGHFFPALAVAEQLKEQLNGNCEIIFIGTENRIESKKAPELGYRYYSMPITGFGGLSFKTLVLPLRVLNSIYKARSVIKINKIEAVICAGAYISYPPGIAASFFGIPLFLMESNVNPGKSNAALAKHSTHIYTAFEESRKYFPSKEQEKVRHFGNPVRDYILNLPDKDDAQGDLGLIPGKPTVLVMGGSLGAMSINRAVERELNRFGEQDYQILWQTGNNYEPPLKHPKNIVPTKFIDDMSAAYAAADLIVGRSGATSVAEICVAGKPSILVPMPSASNNEQFLNAKVLQEREAAILINDSDIETQLFDNVDNLMQNSDMRIKMSRVARQLAKPDAAKRVAKDIIEVINHQRLLAAETAIEKMARLEKLKDSNVFKIDSNTNSSQKNTDKGNDDSDDWDKI